MLALRAAMLQLSIELRRNYNRGSLELYEKADVVNWILNRELGFLIKSLYLDVEGGVTGPRKVRRRHKVAVTLMPLEEIRQRLELIQQDILDTLDVNSYKKCDYVLCGSVRTGGFRLHLLNLKLKELQSVTYRRLPQDILPSRITFTVGSANYYLAKVLNFVKT
ncbi:hypothetical protein BC939DRAFT_505063 [Gamsiella multidivaricata]|uniref:uncharacterized protein n=1 Tax=Gamsiella multidivaricata TaxID=101098 RepID=UPI00221F74BA|nr:uncharacterized protein BC939DRAFT_505063 [Gamsiella multidivaricata]KAI7820449.1 hypothetical protein BC939DRAFT_505063 [Gamsiella multidivaricata]